jgi:hypothetical protein
MQNILRQIKLIQTESNKTTTFVDFLQGYDPTLFVEMHQDYFKDHYLQKYFIDEYNLGEDTDYDLYDHFDLWSLIQQKYEQFFSDLGRVDTHKWLNPSFYSDHSSYLKHEHFTFAEIDYLIGITDDLGDLADDFYDKINELTGESFSTIGYSEFFGALLSDYELYMS